jgi:hypothetical protein
MARLSQTTRAGCVFFGREGRRTERRLNAVGAVRGITARTHCAECGLCSISQRSLASRADAFRSVRTTTSGLVMVVTVGCRNYRSAAEERRQATERARQPAAHRGVITRGPEGGPRSSARGGKRPPVRSESLQRFASLIPKSPRRPQSARRLLETKRELAIFDRARQRAMGNNPKGSHLLWLPASLQAVRTGMAMTRTCSRRALAMNRSIILVAAAMAASLAVAGPEYPPGLFENSPLVPSGPPHAASPSEPPDADVPFEPPDPDAPFGSPDAVAPFGPPDQMGPDDYCAGIAFRTFHSLAEVRRAHALCDHHHELPPPSVEDQPYGWMR